MVDIALSDKQMKPGVIHTDQFENGVHVLRFTIPDYIQNNVDLTKFNAYVVTSINGVMDVTQIPYTISSRQVILTWSLSAYTLKEPGIIQFQIKFASSEKDGAAVWMSYKGVVINRVSINAEDSTSANYPTLMKQWLDLMHTLSSEFGAPVTYMNVGESIPLDERLDGRIYYQWLEIPNSRATCATGIVNLGERPYADSGLYINNVHVCVDTTSSQAFALDPAAWVNAVNNANCGVTATDISAGNDVIMMLVAKNAGASGNSIGLKLDVASYGGGKGVTNPSGGHVSGSTLTGGSDARTAATTPTGQFEDAHGNILGFSRAKYLTNPDLNTILGDGEYICAGTMTNNPISDNTYCIVRVTDSTSTSRVFQECYCVSLTDNSVRTFVRALTSSTDAGAWRELVRDDQLTIAKTQLESLINALGALVGEVKWLAHNDTPDGWLLCDGSTVSRTTYSKLFAAIGTKWGSGDGRTTFNLPNLIGRVAWGGSTVGTYLEAGLPNITGTFYSGGTNSTVVSGAIETLDGTLSAGNGGGFSVQDIQVRLDASKSSSIYGNSNTVQPPAATLRPFIKY